MYFIVSASLVCLEYVIYRGASFLLPTFLNYLVETEGYCMFVFSLKSNKFSVNLCKSLSWSFQRFYQTQLFGIAS